MEPKFEHTQDNHFKWGWSSWYCPPEPKETYRIHLGYTKRKWGSLREECVLACEYIASKATKPIIVGLSGGSDSQMACISFKEARVPFTALICKYKYTNGEIINQHDIATAYQFCKLHNISYQELEINIDEFFKTRALDLARQYCMPKVETIIQTVAMDHVGKDYCYIMAGGDVMMLALRNTVGERLGLTTYNNRFSEPVWTESPVPIMQHMISNGYEGTSKFWLYTPELIASYLTDPVTQDFLKNFDVLMDNYIDMTGGTERLWKCFHYMYKPLMTTREFPELIRTKKYTGYENLYAGAEKIPSKMNVYIEMLQAAVRDLNAGQTIITSVKKLEQYVTTAHSESDLLFASR